MANKIRCSNCGAFLDETDKVCYVCGEPLYPEVVMSDRTARDVVNRAPYDFKENEDFVAPGRVAPRQPEEETVDIGSIDNTQTEDSLNYGDDFDEAMGFEEMPEREARSVPQYDEDDMAEPYYEGDRRRREAQKKHKKKTALIVTIIVLVVALIGGGVWFVFFSGILGGTKPAVNGKYTIYFDKPSVDIDLTAPDGDVYSWSGDVTAVYTLNGKKKEVSCAPCVDHETLWKVKVPEKATQVYFYQSDNDIVRTQVTPSFKNETVYYVAQSSFNKDYQLPLGECDRENFEGIGVNYVTDPTTETTTETEEETTTEADETTAPTETDDTEETEPTEPAEAYSVSVPDSWSDGVTASENGNCTTYYEDYNHDMYEMGTLVSVYVFDADDSTADSLDGVKLTEYTSDKSKKIVVTTPTDVQYNDADDVAVQNYLAVQKDVSNFISSIVIN